MKLVIREDSPQAFEDWKTQEEPTVWDDLPSSLPPPARREAGVYYYSKRELREALNVQQGYLCAYCMAKVDNSHHTRIEHLESRDSKPLKTFTFSNLLTVCNGEDEQPIESDKAYCDNSKGNQALLISPFNKKCQTHFRFDGAGKIHHNSAKGLDTIEKLNLNIRKLIYLRNQAIEDFLLVNNPESEDDFILLNVMLEAKTNSEFIPFCIAILNVLNGTS